MDARETQPTGRVVALARDDGRGARFAIVLVWAVVALVLARPIVARGGWPLAEPARVTLGFGALYSAGEGDSSQHRGVDIEAAAGERVVAPLAGRVTFAGGVPGVGGGRVTAVTIETARGKVTLLPLEHATVLRGAQVGEGDGIGTLADSGDCSSAGPHLHVGVREGDLYVDPLGLIAPPPSAPAVGLSAGAGARAGALEGLGVGAGAGTGTRISAGVSLAPAAGTSATRASAHGKAAAGGELAPGVSITVRGAAPIGVTAAASVAAHVGGGGRLPAAATGAPRATMLTRDGVVVAAGTADVPRQAVGSARISRLVTRARVAAKRSARLASLVLLGVMAALGALWPLWRADGRKGSGKVLVSAAREDVAAAPSR